MGLSSDAAATGCGLYKRLLMPATSPKKPPLSLTQIINMSVGFFGIQFGWDLQRANMGPIYEYLHASADTIPLLFLAAPLTGLLGPALVGREYLCSHMRIGAGAT